MVDVTLELRGDQIGTYTSFSGDGNNDERVVTVNGVEALGTSDDRFTVLVEQVNSGQTEFRNGQFVTIFDADGNVVMTRTGVNDDAEQGLAAGDEHLLITQQPFLIDLGGLPPVGEPDIVRYTIDDEEATVGVGDDDGNLDFADFPCFASGTLVGTALGVAPVETLRPGAKLRTVSGALREVIWIGRRTLDLTPGNARQRPILLQAGCLGPGAPARDLILSPQHRVLLRGAGQAATSAALGPAKGLLPLPGVRAMRGRRRITYVSVLLDRHAVIMAEGAAVESLYPGPQALKTLGPDLAEQVFVRVPGLREHGVAAYGPPAERLLTVRQTNGVAIARRNAVRQRTQISVAAPEPLFLGV
ncbi:MAG: Hint domain-containing protein [Pseudomonadota bacterium]